MLYDQIIAEFTAEVERPAALAVEQLSACGDGLAAVELAIRTAMTQLGAAEFLATAASDAQAL